MNRDQNSKLPIDVLKSVQSGTMHYTYKGVPCLKSPFDLSLYMKLLYELSPRTIIELGSFSGGSAVWLADMLRTYGIDGHVYSIDVRAVTGVSDDRVTFLTGNVLDLGATLSEAMLEALPRPLLVIEDSAHLYETTLAALRFFAPILRSGEYILVEDGIVNDLDYTQYENGPNRAIFDFMVEFGDRFSIDEGYCDFFGHNFTYNTNGYIKRI